MKFPIQLSLVCLGSWTLGAGAGLSLAESRGLTLLTSTAGLLAIAALIWWQSRRMLRGLTIVEGVVAGQRSDTAESLPFPELAELRHRIAAYVTRWDELVISARQQNQAMQQLADQLAAANTEIAQAATPVDKPAARVMEQLTLLGQLVESSVRRILGSTSEIDRSTRLIVQGAEEQADAVSKMATFVEQLSVNIDTVSQNADAAQTSSAEAQQAAVEGLELIDGLVSGMSRIHQHVEASEGRLRGLGQRTQEIGSIVETIGTISARTDLLALNASIESVRAGEHGRGFALVAEEVRKLAEQTAHATREVAELIESVQSETRDSISAMSTERRQVQEEVLRITSAGQALGEIRTTSESAARHADGIARAAQQQLRLTQEVVLAMERISTTSKAIRGRADAVSWTTQSLNQMTPEFELLCRPLRSTPRPHSGGLPEPGRDSIAPGTVPATKPQQTSLAETERPLQGTSSPTATAEAWQLPGEKTSAASRQQLVESQQPVTASAVSSPMSES